MFTGIVEELGSVVAVGDGRLTVRGPLVTSDAKNGDSIAVNGVCLTVVEVGDERFSADVMPETLKRSSLGALRPGDPVNLERPVRASDRLGGHIVQGHVDGVASIVERQPADRSGSARPDSDRAATRNSPADRSGSARPDSDLVRFSLPADLSRYVVEKGSITVDGVSLTVVSVDDGSFTVGLIPTTLALTTLGSKGPGDPVNLEVDLIAKYVERLVRT